MSLIKKVLSWVGKPFVWFKRLRRRNKIIIIILLVIAVFIIANQIQLANAKPPYEVQKARYSDIVQVISETGNISTSGRVDVYSTTTGIIEKLYVQNGSTVKTGQELFRVRSTATDQEKASAYAAYQNAYSAQKAAEQAKLSADAAMWTAQKTLLDAKEDKRVKDNDPGDYEDLERQSIDAAEVLAQKNFSASETKYKEADIAVSAAKAQVTSANLAYQATKNATVKSPAEGTVTNLSVMEGDKVTSGGNSTMSVGVTANSGLPVLTLINPSSRFFLKLSLNEVDIPKIKQGQLVELILDAFSDKKYKGAISHVDSVGTNTQGVVTYNILVDITNPDEDLKSGMTADADIEVDKVTHVLTVPNSAIKPYKGGKAVRVIDPKTKELKFIPVEVGVKGETRTQILKGIKEGQEVVTALTNDQVKRQNSGIF